MLFLRSFLVYFLPFWFVVPRKICQALFPLPAYANSQQSQPVVPPVENLIFAAR
jgi:hypothetical protein